MLERFRSLTKTYMDSLNFETALWWADKATTASDGNESDVYTLGKCMFACRQYHRTAHLMTKRGLDEKYLSCKHLAALSLFRAGMHGEALALLERDFDWKDQVAEPSIQSSQAPHLSNTSGDRLRSSLYLLRGKIHEAADNRVPAAVDFRMALKFDVHCVEAYELLVHHEMLTPQEERQLLDQLPFDDQCNDVEEVALLRALYADRIKKYCKPAQWSPSPLLSKLRHNLAVRVNYAERCLYGCDYRQCLATVEEILKEDPYHEACLPIYITCLVAVKKSQALFRLSHRLVDCDPESPTAWYSVGCYYYVVGKYEEARKYLHKTTSLDRNHGTAWLMRGHAFAAENEHDQAMAAYFKSSQLMRGSHLPMLYVGLEHGLMNNVRLANSFFTQAHSLAPDDPFVLHELGTVAYQNDDFMKAEKYFLLAMEMVRQSSNGPVDETWEPLLNNLGHVCRKLKKYSLALEFHQKALLVCPCRASTYSSLGYVHALTGRSADAVEFFQKSLALKRDDTFSTTMLNLVLDAYLSDAPSFHGAPDLIPLPKSVLPAASLHGTVTPMTPIPAIPLSASAASSCVKMEMSSNISMADISEEESSVGLSLAMATPDSTDNGHRLAAASGQDDSILSGVGPALQTPSASVTTPIGSYGFGFRPPIPTRSHDDDEDRDTTPVIQRR